MFFKMRTRKNPEYQRVLQKAIRIKEILKKIPGTSAKDVFIYPLGIMEDRMSFIQTREEHPKERRDRVSEILEFGVRINEDTHLERDIERYLYYHNYLDFAEMARGRTFDERQALRKAAHLKRDAVGVEIMQKLFGNSYEEFLELTGNDIIDIVFDCIDYQDENRDAYLLHFQFSDSYHICSKWGKRGSDLLAEDINNA